MPFHIKHRPKTFDEFIGNRSTVKSLQSVLASDSPPHVFLFTGSSGTGKTTLARIVKTELGCGDMDFVEINTADYRGIDSARDLIEKSRYNSIFGGRVKCYLLDECHQILKGSQEALLKLLEDTPSHVYFLLCTTEPEKLLKTIRTRCSTFQVTKLGVRQLLPLLTDVAKKEGKAIDEEYLEKVAEAADGSPRQALIILEQIINLQPREMTRAIRTIKDKERTTKDLCRALMERKNWKILSNILRDITDEPETVRRAIKGYFTAVLLNNRNSLAGHILDCFIGGQYIYGSKADLVLACWKAHNYDERK